MRNLYKDDGKLNDFRWLWAINFMIFPFIAQKYIASEQSSPDQSIGRRMWLPVNVFMSVLVAIEYFYMRRQEAISEQEDLGHVLPDDFSNATSYFIKKGRAQQAEMEQLSNKKVVDEKISIPSKSSKDQKINKAKQYGSF